MADLNIIQFPDQPTAFDVSADPEFYTSDGNPDTYPIDGMSGVHVTNSTGSSVTVTMVAARECSHGVLHDATIVVPDGFSDFIDFDPNPERFANETSGRGTLNYSASGLGIAIVRRS